MNKNYKYDDLTVEELKALAKQKKGDANAKDNK